MAAAPVAAPKPAFFGSCRPEAMLPSALYSLFCSAMPVGVLKVAVEFLAFNCTVFSVLKISARNSKLRDSWNFQKRNRRTTDVSTLSVGQPRIFRRGDSMPVLP